MPTSLCKGFAIKLLFHRCFYSPAPGCCKMAKKTTFQTTKFLATPFAKGCFEKDLGVDGSESDCPLKGLCDFCELC